MARGIDDGLTAFRLVGPRDVALRYVSKARALLIGQQQNFLDSRINLTRRRYALPDGATIEIFSHAGLNLCIINVTEQAEVLAAARVITHWAVYEFAAENSALNVDVHRWFKIFTDARGVWDCIPYPVHDFWDLQPPREGIPSLVQFGGGLTDGTPQQTVNPIDGNVWYGPARSDGTRMFRGAGNQHDPAQGWAPHGNHIIDLPIGINIIPYWYQEGGRDNFDAGSPTAEGLTADGQFTVAVTPDGTVIVTHIATGTEKSKSTADLWPDWVKANDWIPGAWGAWRLNSACTRAVSVLYGNTICYAAYNGTFDHARLLDPNESPDIEGAFTSRIYEVTIAVVPNTTTPENFTITVGISPQTDRVEVLADDLKDPHTWQGKMYLAADYSESDALLWALIDWETEEIINWNSDDPCPECTASTPWCDAYNIRFHATRGEHFDCGVDMGSKSRDGTATDPCDGVSKDFFDENTVRNIFFDVPKETAQYAHVRTIDRKAVLKTNVASIPDTTLQQFSSREDAFKGQGNQSWGFSVDMRLFSENSPPGSPFLPDPFVTKNCFDVWEPFIQQIIDDWCVNGVPASPEPPLADPFCGDNAFIHSFEINNIDKVLAKTRELLITFPKNEINTVLRFLDLRAGVLAYEETEVQRGTIDGLEFLNNATSAVIDKRTIVGEVVTTVREVLKTPIETKTVVVSTTAQAEQTQDDVFPPAGYPFNQFGPDETSGSVIYPMDTRLWYQMAMGAPDPVFDFISVWQLFASFAQLPDQWDRQMAKPLDSVAWHPDGHLAYRMREASGDKIRFVGSTRPRLDGWTISHAEAIDKAAERADQMIADYQADNPGVSDEDAAEATGAITDQVRADLKALMIRGHWTVVPHRESEG